MLIRRADAFLLVIDIQEKLAPAIADSDTVTANAVRLLTGSRLLGLPAFVSEHYRQGLGATVEAVRAAAKHAHFFDKIHFSCAAEPGVLDLLRASGRRQVVLCGSETHVCVLQTALELIAAGFEVYLVADAAGSRTTANKQAAIDRLRAAGGHIVTTEMVLFECLQRGDSDEFRAVLPLVK